MLKMTKSLTAVAVAALLSGTSLSLPAFAANDAGHNDAGHKAAADVNAAPAPVMVGGAPMYSTKNIVENASMSKDHTTLVAAVKAAGLVDTLAGDDMLTVFAPTNAAFAKLPAGTVETLLKPENKDKLTEILTYHVVSGSYDAKKVMAAIKDGNGTATLTTVEGEDLKAMIEGGKVVLTDAKGGKSTVTQADVFQRNGVVHVVDTVLMPAK